MTTMSQLTQYQTDALLSDLEACKLQLKRTCDRLAESIKERDLAVADAHFHREKYMRVSMCGPIEMLSITVSVQAFFSLPAKDREQMIKLNLMDGLYALMHKASHQPLLDELRKDLP